MSTYPDASDCQRCDIARRKALLDAENGDPWDHPGGMITCPTCGNKRCPRATYHGYECTRSNAPNQPGSSYQICCCDWGDMDRWENTPAIPNPRCTVEGHAP